MDSNSQINPGSSLIGQRRRYEELDPDDLRLRNASKKTLMDYLQLSGKFGILILTGFTTDNRYLDVPEQCNREFIQQLLKGEKKAFKAWEVVPIKLLHYPEFSMDHLSEMFFEDEAVG